jgi:hypothetical protein
MHMCGECILHHRLYGYVYMCHTNVTMVCHSFDVEFISLSGSLVSRLDWHGTGWHLVISYQ